MTYYVRAGVRVDKKHSDERQVTLKDLSMKSTGRYRCEVSTEAPTFETVSSYGDMIVVGKERKHEDFTTLYGQRMPFKSIQYMDRNEDLFWVLLLEKLFLRYLSICRAFRL